VRMAAATAGVGGDRPGTGGLLLTPGGLDGGEGRGEPGRGTEWVPEEATTLSAAVLEFKLWFTCNKDLGSWVDVAWGTTDGGHDP
jgi:hypothetical protein